MLKRSPTATFNWPPHPTNPSQTYKYTLTQTQHTRAHAIRCVPWWPDRTAATAQKRMCIILPLTSNVCQRSHHHHIAPPQKPNQPPVTTTLSYIVDDDNTVLLSLLDTITSHAARHQRAHHQKQNRLYASTKLTPHIYATHNSAPAAEHRNHLGDSFCACTFYVTTIIVYSHVCVCLCYVFTWRLLLRIVLAWRIG